MMATTSTERRGLLRGLYAITPETRDLGRLLGQVRAAIDGGARLVQYRAKHRSAGERRREAQALLVLCRDRGIPLIVNDDLDLATALGADGVHLGRGDGDPRAARERLPGAILGVSCYDDPALAVAAAAAGADYVGVGSVFASSTKPNAVRCGLAALAEAKRVMPLPVAAIGGINAANARDAVAAGADMLAVLTALFDAPDVAAAARALCAAFHTESGPHVRTKPAAV